MQQHDSIEIIIVVRTQEFGSISTNRRERHRNSEFVQKLQKRNSWSYLTCTRTHESRELLAPSFQVARFSELVSVRQSAAHIHAASTFRPDPDIVASSGLRQPRPTS